MKIGELEQHCGECGVCDYCGEAYCYCLCTDERFEFVEEETYLELAATVEKINSLAVCAGCKRPDCGSYRYSDEDYAVEECEYADESRDYKCLQIADHVHDVLQSGGVNYAYHI